ncbi:hypothetical protein [Cellulomonas cellasea]|uniref:Uncharacterized protein n=2 Tax=Cellulomonas cellasea TaxID=43670 RepID=A0A0A0B758_9CELL|nr:hypothetical protein [Cellulomonas cellasea]KGM01071.1 hypothetical protein Q760_04190 [Cellulomonas cellasea DSM 20118]GEA87531.1 hypothetical protein CCE01nite_14800 [Cellulomonas cellasea]
MSEAGWPVVVIGVVLSVFAIGTRWLVQHSAEQDRVWPSGEEPPGRRISDMTAFGKACLGVCVVAFGGGAVTRHLDAGGFGWWTLAAVVAGAAVGLSERRRLRRLGLPLVPSEAERRAARAARDERASEQQGTGAAHP